MKYFLITLLAFTLMGASNNDARKANEAYNDGNYEEAISLYKKAIDANPQNAKLYYNLASAQAKAGKNEDAIRTFEQFKSMTDNPDDRAKANYNMGNVFANGKKWDKALDYYKKSLRYMAKDEDAKHNYELAKQKQKENQKKKKNKNNKQNQDKQKDKQNKNQQKQNQDQKDKQNQNQNQQNKQNQQNQNRQKNQQQPQKMSKAEAEKILKALEQKEKDLLKQFKKQKTESSKSKNEKDW
ncbi:MAG: tetratricopeptide repeat protein [Balneolaceae bacterium]|jgi:Ca-activated chloride channel family protein